LLVGRGGTGKTTVALACLAGEFHYLGDDYVALEELVDGSFVGHSVYCSAWLTNDNLLRFPYLISDTIRGRDQNRNLVILSRSFSDRLACSAPIRTVVLPLVTDKVSSHVRAASKREAILALAPTSILNLPTQGACSLAKMARLVEQVPCYWFELGNDLTSVPKRLDGLLKQLGAL
jgi:hypothetical protein